VNSIFNFLKNFKKWVQLVNCLFFAPFRAASNRTYDRIFLVVVFFVIKNNNIMSTNDNPALQQSQYEEVVSSDSDEDDVDDDPTEEPTKKKATNGRAMKCRWCRRRPCIMADGVFYDCLLEYFQDFVEPEYEAKNLTEKEVRFRLYRHATSLIHGYLGKGVRIELPQCVRGDILDLIPAPDGKYVGFKPAKTDDE
jgi:hypothetical protein